ncbi:rod-determining factor RdfA [Haloplanus halobius]|uniref:rod-determining factor RdfA n=1 Tax=Haloplanus halobius TaxID=2934938 RepID=UPI0031F32E13
MAEDTGGRSRRSSKVARMIAEYDVDESLGDELERLWTAEGQQRKSLRDLADFFNKQLLESAMTAAGISTVNGEVSNLYRLLTADDVSSGMRTEARTRLEREGVDIEQLERDFVSYQAIRSYLTEYRDASYEQPSDSEQVESVLDSIRRLQSRLRSLTEGSLDRLRSTGRITLGEFRLFIDIDVLCEDCGAQYGVIDLLERGGCDCEGET